MRFDGLTERVCVLPGDERLVGNHSLPAVQCGATAGFMERAAIVFLPPPTDVAREIVGAR